jgi:hypothetical protein
MKKYTTHTNGIVVHNHFIWFYTVLINQLINHELLGEGLSEIEKGTIAKRRDAKEETGGEERTREIRRCAPLNCSADLLLVYICSHANDAQHKCAETTAEIVCETLNGRGDCSSADREMASMDAPRGKQYTAILGTRRR